METELQTPIIPFRQPSCASPSSTSIHPILIHLYTYTPYSQTTDPCAWIIRAGFVKGPDLIVDRKAYNQPYRKAAQTFIDELIFVYLYSWITVFQWYLTQWREKQNSIFVFGTDCSVACIFYFRPFYLRNEYSKSEYRIIRYATWYCIRN